MDILKGDPSQLELSLTRAAQLSSNIMLIGDLNINLLENSHATDKLTELCSNIGLRQKIKEPTRIDGTSATLIDHMWITDDCAAGESGVIAGISDHLATFLEIKKPPKETEVKITCRTYKNYNADTAQRLYTELIEKSKFRESLKDHNLDEAVEEWIRVAKQVCDATAPIKTFTKAKEENHVPWFNSEVVHLKNVRASLLKIKNRPASRYQCIYKPGYQQAQKTQEKTET